MLLCLGKKSCHGDYYFLLDLSHLKYSLYILQQFSTPSRYDPVEHGVEQYLYMIIVPPAHNLASGTILWYYGMFFSMVQTWPNGGFSRAVHETGII